MVVVLIHGCLQAGRNAPKKLIDASSIGQDANGRHCLEFSDGLIIYFDQQEDGSFCLSSYEARDPLVVELAQEYLRVCLLPNKPIADISGKDLLAAWQLMGLLASKTTCACIYQGVSNAPIILDAILTHAINFAFWSARTTSKLAHYFTNKPRVS